jgi:hypothetical protein
MNQYSSVDESQDRLHQSGWSIGETAAASENNLVWLVSGNNGENVGECG